jgi:hypothetical protein
MLLREQEQAGIAKERHLRQGAYPRLGVSDNFHTQSICGARGQAALPQERLADVVDLYLHPHRGVAEFDGLLQEA